MSKKSKAAKKQFSWGRFISILISLSLVFLVNYAIKKNTSKNITDDFLNEVAKENMPLTVFGFILLGFACFATIYVVVKKIDLSKVFKI